VTASAPAACAPDLHVRTTSPAEQPRKGGQLSAHDRARRAAPLTGEEPRTGSSARQLAQRQARCGSRKIGVMRAYERSSPRNCSRV
jgi:hypothetical protein